MTDSSHELLLHIFPLKMVINLTESIKAQATRQVTSCRSMTSANRNYNHQHVQTDRKPCTFSILLTECKPTKYKVQSRQNVTVLRLASVREVIRIRAPMRA